MFRGKESSNRIELSGLVQDLLNFGVLGSLWLWGGCRWVGSIWGHGRCPHRHAHAHTCTHTFIHGYKLQMAADMEASMFSMFNMHVCACVHACVCDVCVCRHAWDTPHTPIPTSTPIHPSATPPGGRLPESLKIR